MLYVNGRFFDLLLLLLSPHALNVDPVKHIHLSCDVLTEVCLLSLLLPQVVKLYRCQSLVEVFKELPVFLSGKKTCYECLLLLFEGDKLLKLLLLKLVADELDILAEVADLGDLLLLSLSELLINLIYVLLHFLFCLKKTAACVSAGVTVLRERHVEAVFSKVLAVDLEFRRSQVLPLEAILIPTEVIQATGVKRRSLMRQGNLNLALI